MTKAVAMAGTIECSFNGTVWKSESPSLEDELNSVREQAGATSRHASLEEVVRLSFSALGILEYVEIVSLVDTRKLGNDAR